MRTVAQRAIEHEVEAAARAEKKRRLVRPQARTVAGDEHVGCQLRLVLLARRTQSWRANLLAHPEQPLHVATKGAARSQQMLERGEVDGVLSLVVGRATAVPAVALLFQHPRRGRFPPLLVVSQYDISVAVHQDRREVRGLGPHGEEEGGPPAAGLFHRLVLNPIRSNAGASVGAIGVGVNEVEVCIAVANRIDVDCVLLAGRYSLLEQGALDEFLPLWRDAGHRRDRRRPIQLGDPC